jgi:hypothetical protein
MRIPRLSQCRWWVRFAAFGLASTSVATAQSRPPSDALGILVVSLDRAPSATADSVVAATLGELRRIAPSVGLRIISWRDIVREFPSDLPRAGALSSSDLIELGKQFRAVTLALRVRAGASGPLEISPTLMGWRETPTIVPWPTIAAATAQEAGRRIAQQVVGDSIVRRLNTAERGCPTKVLFEFEVDVQARRIDDSTEPALRTYSGGRGETILQFVVDTLGHPERATVKVIKTSDTTTAHAIQDSVRHWLFEPARRGTCRVRQLLQLPVR